MSSIPLRPYQLAALEAVETAYRQEIKRPVVSMPTGTGKTIVLAELLRRRKQTALVLAHRDELVRQAAEKIHQVWPEAHVGIVKGAEDEWQAPVVVASVQSLHSKRLHRWAQNQFQTIIIDECFPAGTLVEGRPIETWRPGDIIRAYDPETNRWASVLVTGTHRRSTRELMEITLESEVLRCTLNHPFYTREGWIEAEFLQAGDWVLGESGWIAVQNATPLSLSTPVDVFNLDVDTPHTYLVGQAGLVVHNCHHAPAPSYRKILEYLSPDLLLGVSATPFRKDLTSLTTVFDQIVYSYGIREAIQDGWLVDIRAVRVEGQADLDDVATRGGDFVEGQLQTALNSPARNALIVEAYQTHAPGTKAIVFTAGVQHAHDLARAFQDHGIVATAVDGGMSLDERRARFRAFHEGHFRILVNAQLATEGYDEPTIETVILARPTKSLALFTQMVGRGTRPSPGKTAMTLIDVADNTRRHKLITLADLIGLRRPLKAGETVAQRIARETQIPANAEHWLEQWSPLTIMSEEVPSLYLDLVDSAAPALDWRDIRAELDDIMADADDLRGAIRRAARLMQNPIGSSTDAQRHRLQEFGWPDAETARLPKWAASYALDRHRTVLAEWAAGRVRQWAKLVGADHDQLSQMMTQELWHYTPATAKQQHLLRRLGTPADIVITLTKGEAAWLIDQMLAKKAQTV
ncbi:type III restriction protein res subunit [Sulfobacillus acidophilus TPY]|uniref:Type III restriction protein res subunit n=1 Tax=Sulfobacillus acidophilus (strain ATCC 700253 / DSM 10332 / NAL) TaxID=679936 RepID=G8TU18_SULAD|nr:type III restriction protein res subunit [Sulfobacillus acidophilus TPY]AEW04609.1 type III restriction protein res subunit [Sulfobacillus acidophilus DSM 10332]